MTVAAGSRVGSYEITALLGVGGMGEVYRALDSRLKREVAIKVLPPAFTADAERLARFEREAQLLAQLQHPNVASIYGLEEWDGVRALVMELVEGEDLSALIARGPLPVADAVAIAKQIAEAVEAAHERGIVHRDLKPGNVKVRADGTVKVLDFGLAKALDESNAAIGGPATSPTLMNSPTITGAPGTQLGVILGTAAYMAPEQARGAAVDERADVWAFGLIVYEMLTGRSPFLSDTVPDTLAAVLARELDWSALPASCPAALRDLLRRCLERRPRNRLHAIADARIVLDDLAAGKLAVDTTATVPVTPTPQRRNRLAWLAAGVAIGAIAAAILGVALWRRSPERPPVVHSLTYSGSSSSGMSSPDGRFLVFASNRDGTSRIWLKQLATGEEVALTAGEDTWPRISPDSSTVLFGHVERDAIDLYRVPIVGGEPRRIARDVASAEWSPDGQQVVIARNRGLRSQLILIPAGGGEERRLLDEDVVLRSLSWSADGRRILFGAVARINAIAAMTLQTVDVATGARRTLYRAPVGSVINAARWDGDAVLFVWSPTQVQRGGALLERLEPGVSTPRPVYSFTATPVRFELAGPGAIVFDEGGRHQNLFELGTGSSVGAPVTGGLTLDRQPAFSPDGKRIVFSSDRSGSLDLWSIDLGSRAMRRLTVDPSDEWDPQWSPDGKHLLWSSNKSGHFEVWMGDADGTDARQVTSDGVDAENPAMTADGAWILYASGNPAARGFWKVHADGSGRAPVLSGPVAIPELAPVSGWVAGVGSDASRSLIRIVRLPDGAPLASIPVRTAGPRIRARWLPDGRTLVFTDLDADGRISLFRQEIVPGRDTSAERRLVARSDDRHDIETFGISPVDGRIVVSAGWNESDIMLVEGIPGIGESLPKRAPR